RAAWGPVPPSSAVMAHYFALPARTATFLSADLVSSGRDVDEAVHSTVAVLNAAVGRHGGVWPADQQQEGSMLAAFARASDALACALEVQRELQASKVFGLRTGVHTGEEQVHGQVSYFGRVTARTDRLRDLGHGGQVLVSRATADLVADHLPEGASLADLGTNRLRDLSRPAHVYQLCHKELADSFPPLRSLDRYPHNLAVQLTSLVGRDTAVVEVGALLVDHGLVTLTGSGGCGKTRMALQVAAEALGATADEAWFVDLSAVADPGLVPATATLAASDLGNSSGSYSALVFIDNNRPISLSTSAPSGPASAKRALTSAWSWPAALMPNRTPVTTSAEFMAA
ncbi:MAG TPA: hypothetical protein VEJ84_03265, partial [Acidimicrobiales bacterium]|nr:hypothetical protein [Acidimicrobiales bacterium]